MSTLRHAIPPLAVLVALALLIRKRNRTRPIMGHDRAHEESPSVSEIAL